MAPLGNLVRLLPLHVNELPAHSALESLVNPDKSSNSNTAERPNLISFVEEVLDQAAIFVKDTLPNTFKKGNLKSSSPSKAPVRLLSRDIGDAATQSVPWINSSIPRNWSANGRKPPEAWFARRSRHANQSAEGTADLDEFDFGLRHEHSKHEQEYTPDVFDAYRVLDWDDQINAVVEGGSKVDNYSSLSMSIFEMCHKLPPMLSNRVFPVLVVTAKRGKQSLIVVQIPIDISNLAAAFYSNGRNLKEGDSSLKRKAPVLGVYTSIESCQTTPEQDIEWVMATASDAKGWLPMFIQKLGVPAAVVKDVGFFMRWIGERRRSIS